MKTKTRSVFKKLFGGKRMKSERKNVLGTMFTLLIFIGSMFASLVIVAPAAVAASGGNGNIVSFAPDVVTELIGKDVVVTLHNNEPVGGDCIDEITITAPDNWGGQAVVQSATNLGAHTWDNKADDGTYNGIIPADWHFNCNSKCFCTTAKSIKSTINYFIYHSRNCCWLFWSWSRSKKH